MTHADVGPSPPCVEWVNHAGFVLRGAHAALLVDPWLSGSAFNDGWDLLVPSVFTPSDVANVTHIWFSHEHPDHFAPAVLRQVPEPVRAVTEVLFQVTPDHRVVESCRRLGFAVRELPDLERYELAEGFEVMVGRHDVYDSWLFCEVDGRRILDLNDCIVQESSDLQRLHSATGDVDVLLTQFSYASWIGSRDEPELREAAASERLLVVARQLEAVRAQWYIPSASFSFFSHEENSYLNDRRNSADDAVEVAERSGALAITLFPGDSWQIGSEHDGGPALEKYRQAFDLRGRPLRRSESVPIEELIDLGSSYAARIRSKNNGLFLRLVRLRPLSIGQPIVIHLSDHDRSVRFDPFDGIQVVDDRAHDIVMASDSLAFCLRFEFGSETLSVNGRFTTATRADCYRLLNAFGVGALNYRGKSASPRLFLKKEVLVRVLKRVRRIGRSRDRAAG